MQAEMRRQIEGAPPRDMSVYTKWRKDLRPENRILIAYYATYLSGQCAGMTNALSLPALVASFDIDGVTQEQRPDLAKRLLYLHSLIVEAQRKEK